MDNLQYDPAAIEGFDGCSPACINAGVCQNKICFCPSPFGGDYCEIDLGIVTRVNILVFILLLVGGLIIGFLLVFVLKFLWDFLFYKEPKPKIEEEDAWKPS
jgi:hypothetical protein